MTKQTASPGPTRPQSVEGVGRDTCVSGNPGTFAVVPRTRECHVVLGCPSVLRGGHCLAEAAVVFVACSAQCNMLETVARLLKSLKCTAM